MRKGATVLLKEFGQDEERSRKFSSHYAIVVSDEDSEGDVRVKTDNGYGCWYPVNAMEEVPPEKLTSIIELPATVDVRDKEAVHDLLIRIIGNIDFLGGPVRLMAMIYDQRTSDMYQLGPKDFLYFASVMLQRSLKEEEGGRPNLDSMLRKLPPPPPGLSELLGMLRGKKGDGAMSDDG